MFTLTFETDNDAFTGGNREVEIARILRHVAYLIEERAATSGKVRDNNGNTIGTFTNQK